MRSFGPTPRIVVVGMGSIGTALADLAEASGAEVTRLNRNHGMTVDNEAAIAASFDNLTDLAAVVVTTGILHRGNRQPERDWRQLDSDWMAESFAVNAILPALVAKHALPRLRRGQKALFAALSARVGSIADNRLGGWYSYRASKAALNQYVRTLAIELARKNPTAACIGLHPGTVDTGMSKPFQRNMKPGQLRASSEAAERLWAVMDAITPEHSGGFFDWKGEAIPF